MRRWLFRLQRRWDRLMGTTLACLAGQHGDQCPRARSLSCMCDCHFQF